MKLYHIDFSEMIRENVIDDDGTERVMTFEDSDMYAYFADHALLCIMFQEAPEDPETKYRPNSLSSNGLKELYSVMNLLIRKFESYGKIPEIKL